ncbi:hypothetical protein C823_003212 [Eubacterium plexicaudatum ASF492]|uniref:AlgX/AlgJ SGNH hydrolase-like domain-containing protein n=1 Tax=Eubacterium plexicaudatum ASF492 TaxID=1235802 RepID=N2AM46_9FIRM|nr:hypothetical protein C823_003212 [Eubacterium plexicaudatum ASF492]
MQRHPVFICMLAVLFLSVSFLFCLFLKKPEYSDTERRYLAKAPKLSVETVKSGRFMSDFEAFALDTFPFRERLRTIKSWTAAYLMRLQDWQGLYESDGYFAVMEYPMREASLTQAAERFAAICRRYATVENAVYLSVIPDKNCFLAEESGHLSMDYKELEHKMEQKAGFADYILISDLLEMEDYYKTDPHWRQENITDIADRLAEQMGAVINEEYTLHTATQTFYGAYYGQSGLSAQPDTLRYLTGDAINRCSVYDWQNDKQIAVYDMEKAAGKDPYELYLSGPLSLVTIENPKAQRQKRLVMFRDSFGSALAPLLVGGYASITLVDIRYIRPEVLGRFVDFKDCDILFLYSTLVLNNSESLLSE